MVAISETKRMATEKNEGYMRRGGYRQQQSQTAY